MSKLNLNTLINTVINITDIDIESAEYVPVKCF